MKQTTIDQLRKLTEWPKDLARFQPASCLYCRGTGMMRLCSVESCLHCNGSGRVMVKVKVKR